MSTHEEYPEYEQRRDGLYEGDGWLPRWLVPLLVTLFLLSTVGAIGGGWYIAHRLDVSTVDDT